MNVKTICKKSFFTKYFFAGCFFLLTILFVSCGLDVYHEIESPTKVLHEPSYNSSYGERYSIFVTEEEKNSELEGFKFLGTDVYYRIYDSTEDLTRDVNALNSLKVSTNNSSAISAAADRLITPKSGGGYGYCKLTATQEISSGTLIPSDANSPQDRTIKIRLTNYGPVSEFHSYIDIENGPTYTPVRYNHKTFDFGRHGSNDAMPVQGDEDYSYSSSGSDVKYVAMFALGIGHDENISMYYSNILYIGSVPIDSTSPDN